MPPCFCARNPLFRPAVRILSSPPRGVRQYASRALRWLDRESPRLGTARFSSSDACGRCCPIRSLGRPRTLRAEDARRTRQPQTLPPSQRCAPVRIPTAPTAARPRSARRAGRSTTRASSASSTCMGSTTTRAVDAEPGQEGVCYDRRRDAEQNKGRARRPVRRIVVGRIRARGRRTRHDLLPTRRVRPRGSSATTSRPGSGSC